MKKTLLLAASLAALSAYGASVAGTVANNPNQAAFADTDYSNSNWTVTKFNLAGQTLTSVDFKLTMAGQSQIGNTGAQSDTFNGSTVINFTITKPSSGTAAGSINITVPAQVIGPGTIASPTFGPFSPGNGIATLSTSAAGDLAALTGAGGPVAIPLAVQGGITGLFGGGGNAQMHTQAQVSLEVTYNYRPSEVPEPSFYGAMGALVCFGLLGYRQYRAKQNA